MFHGSQNAKTATAAACKCPHPEKTVHFHPHGIYQDAPYHTKSGNTLKSPRPFDGQLALDYSIQIKETSPRRIGVSRGQIVIIDRTQEGLYHGHVVKWDNLLDIMRNRLKDAGLTNAKGKILKKELL